ncbi:MAG: hypothetical protein PHI60_01055 [Candidatus Omnitrophica bacterium]|nr:hypothetical protein [Candidatus Omnitrophota bacterium]
MNNATWNVIQDNVPAGDGNVSWPISNNTQVSQIVLARVQDASNPEIVNDTSNSTFNIIAVFNITHPENGDVVIAEEPYNITWTKQGLNTGNVTLEYVTNATDWGWVIPGGDHSTDNTGTYYWASVPSDKLSETCQIRIRSLANPNATDTGYDYFMLRGNITVTAPAGGEGWQVGTPHNISWDRKGNISSVNIYYSSNNGGAWSSVIAGVTAANETWEWNIPTGQTTSALNQARINITDASIEEFTYNMSAGFTLQGSLNLTAPSASGIVMSYTGTSTYNIAWAKYGGIDQVQLRYSTDGNQTYPDPQTIGNFSAGDSPQQWTIPDKVGYNLSVKVIDKNDTTVYDTSNNLFAVKGSILVLSPNGGENWTKGSSQQVRWRPTGSYPGNVKIEYYNNSAGAWEEIGQAAAGADNVNQTWDWTPIPDDIGGNTLVRVSTQTNNASIEVNDTSNSTFKIIGNVSVATPNGGETWYVGEQKTIQWNSVGTVTPVRIEYSTDSINWTIINNTYPGTEGLNNLTWIVNESLKSEDCLIRVSDNRTLFNTLVRDTSNATFKIRPQINITQPTSNANITVNSVTTPIRWTYTGTSLDKVNTYYATDGGINWTNIESSVDVENGTFYIWPQVPIVVTPNAKVKVNDSTNDLINGTSSQFNIIGSLRVISPNGNENWKVGSSHTISWTSTAVTNIQPYYSLNNGGNWTPIGDPVPAVNGSTTWTIENATSNTALIRITDVSNEDAVKDQSNATFNVIAVFNITHPENGDVAVAEEPYNITWTKQGTGVDWVTLEYSTDEGGNWSWVVPGGNHSVANNGNYYWSSVNGSKLSETCKILIRDLNNANASDTGYDVFMLRGNISVTRPQGDEEWNLSTIENVTWTKKGAIPTVDIFYSADNGGNWTPVGTTITAGNLTWPWNITNSTSVTTQGKIKVADSALTNFVYNISGGTFAIRGKLNLTAPSASGIVMNYNGTNSYNIAWTKAGNINNVRLRYSTDGGSSYPNTINNTVNATTGTPYNWTIPDSIGYNLSVNVTDVNNTDVYDTSNNLFAIKGSMLVLSPNGDESWVKGSTQQIRWRPTGSYPGNVKIEYYNNSASAWEEIGQTAAGTDDVDQTWNWTPIPDDIGVNTSVRISTQTNNASIEVNDTSNATFKIKGNIAVATPNGGETWYVGEQKTIQWNSVGTVTPVRIEYSTDSGGNWTIINNTYPGTEGLNNFTWIVNESLKSEDCLIRVSDNRSAFISEVTDNSNATFKIRPQINVTVPALNANIPVDTSTPIRWTYTGTALDKVNIDYSTNGGANYTNIETSVDVEDGATYVWPSVPIIRTSNARVKVYDNTNEYINDTSESFNIVGKLSLSIPNDGSQSWEILTNSSQIVWTSTAINTINIYYSVAGLNGTYNYSTSANASLGSINWDVPAIVTNNARIKITDSSNEDVTFDISENDFKLIEKFNITQPENNIVLMANQSYDIKWTRKSSGALANVDLWYYNGTGWALIDDNVTNSGTYAGWQVPDTGISDQCKVKVQSSINADNYAESDPTFGVRGEIVVTNPSTGYEVWKVGTTYPINWSYIAPINNVTIQYSNNSTSGPWTTLVSRTSAGTNGAGSWNWTIPNGTVPSTTARINISDVDHFQEFTYNTSPYDFTVEGALRVTAPNATNITLYVGDQYNITWDTFGLIPKVNLSYTTHGTSGPWIPIAANYTAVPSIYDWDAMPDAVGSGLRVRVMDSTNNNVWNISSYNFSVFGKLNLVRPDPPSPAEPAWVVGETRQISWIPTGTFPNIRIEGVVNDTETFNITVTPAGASEVQQNLTIDVPNNITSNFKIKISDDEPSRYPYVTDISTEGFQIKGKIIVDQPNGGEEWVAGTMPSAVPVRWTTYGNIANVKIELLDGTKPALTIIESTPCNGTFSEFLVNDTAVNTSAVAKIRVSNALDSSVNDTSNNPFLIKGSINLTNPHIQNEGIFANSTYAINWTKTGIYDDDTVKIEYNINDGAWMTVADPIAVTAGGYPWLVNGSQLTSNAKVKITRNRYPAINMTSPQFRIIGRLHVTSPVVEGERWASNQTGNYIKWTREGNVTNVTLSYSTDGANYTPIGSYDGWAGDPNGIQWIVPDIVGIVTPTAYIKVADTSDQSVNNISPRFNITPKFAISAPVYQQKLLANRPAYIAWNSWGKNDYVDLYYSKESNFANSTLIEASVTNNGNYTWNVPEDLNNTVRVRVIYPNDTEVYNTSDAFRIVPGYSVISPDGPDDKWPVYTVRQITWNSTSSGASAPTVKLYYSIDGGGNYTPINESVSNAGAANATRYYNWTVEDDLTDAFKIKVEDAAAGRTDIYSESPNSGEIIKYYRAIFPNGGGVQNFTVNDPCTIRWEHNGTPAGMVRLDIAKDDDWLNATPITASTPNDDIYDEVSWTIPDLISNNTKIRVMATNDPDAFDTSDNYFKVKGSLSVTMPVNGTRWPIAYDSNINWTTVGNISNVRIIAYSTQTNDPRFNYTLADPYEINASYPNTVGDNQTNFTAQANYSWSVPDNATDNARIRVIDANDPSVYSDSSGNFSIIGSFTLNSPNGNETWMVGTTHNITWVPTGGSITEAKVTYSINSTNGTGGNWTAITENWNVSNDGIVNNSGAFSWVVPDSISSNVYLRIEDPEDPTVGDTSLDSFSIIGGFNISSPAADVRWVTFENRTITWDTAGSVNKVNIIYSPNNFTNNYTVVSNLTTGAGVNNYVWQVSNPIPTVIVNDTFLPLPIKLRIIDANDSSVYTDSPEFDLDFYSITWEVYDILSNLSIGGGLNVSDTSGWIGTNTYSGVVHKTPYGSWVASWSHPDYGEKGAPYLSSTDHTERVDLESKIVHVWEASTEYVFDPAIDKISFSSTLTRDGTIVTGAHNCTITVFDYDGQGTNMTLNQPNPDSAGFFALTWDDTNLNTSRVLNARTSIQNVKDAFFHSPFMINLQTTQSLYDVATTVAENINVPLSVFEANITRELTNQTEFINQTLTNQTLIIENKTDLMIDAVESSLSSFESQVNITIAKLESGAEQAVAAGETATLAAEELEATAKKYSWSASASPNPAMVNDNVTLQAQGQAGKSPDLSIYSWDNKVLISTVMPELSEGLYQYNFLIDSKFTAGKAYTYVVAESDTGGLVAGSATVEATPWIAGVSPNPVLVNENVTLTVSGREGLQPTVTLTSWDDAVIVEGQTLTESVTDPGVYTYTFQIDERFTPGKSYTYLVTEPRTARQVRGSGQVESMSISTIAGLASAAPEAERAAKKALDAITALEAVILSQSNVNIGATLKNLQDSINNLPALMEEAAGGTNKVMGETINEIAERLKKLAGEEGYDIKSLIEKNLGESPTLKEVRKNTDSISSVVQLLLKLYEAKFGGEDAPVVSVGLEAGSVVFRVMAANPSATKTQTVDVKYYLPQEVKPKDVIETGGLDLEYDSSKSIYYIYRSQVELAPSEIRVFDIEVEDVWLIPDSTLADYKKITDNIMARLQDTEYYSRAKSIADTIYPRLDEIAALQTDDAVSREQHIGIYRQNGVTLTQIKEDIAKLEKILVTAGGPPAPEMLAKTKIKADEPSKTMTWMVIFIIIIFTGLLAGVFFFTWHRQTREAKEELEAAKKDAFPESKPSPKEPKDNA